MILGINDWAHDTSASIISDKKVIGCVEEERFTGKKHCGGFEVGGCSPINSMKWCLDKAGVKINELDAIALGWDIKFWKYPFRAFNSKRLLGMNPPVDRSFRNIYHDGIKDNVVSKVFELLKGFYMRRIFVNELRKSGVKIVFVNHHLSHASSAFRVSGFEKANIVVIDGAGESESLSLWLGDGKKITRLKSLPIKQSLGYLYERITVLLGMGTFGFGKTMGLGPYGVPRKKFCDMVSVNRGVDFKINLDVLKKLERYRRYGGRLTQDHKDIAASLQYVLEKVMKNIFHYIYGLTGVKDFCIAGGVGLNCCMNGELLNLPFVKDLFVQPCANDGGVSLGAALEVGKCKFSRMTSSSLGPSYSNEEIKKCLGEAKLDYEWCDDIAGEVAELVANNKIVGWFQGKLEFGPRALGNRSILANPCNPEMPDIVNNIKKREPWRPLCPSVLEEDMNKYFESDVKSPFMIINFSVKEKYRKFLPSITHVDGSARVQSVNKKYLPLYHSFLKKLKRKTGFGVVLNTSFNDKGQPIVRSPKDAFLTFGTTGLDALAIGNYLVKKK